jgi:hypothetical protein
MGHATPPAPKTPLSTLETATMNVTTNSANQPETARPAFLVTVGRQQCVVRASSICSISEVLGFESEMDLAIEGLLTIDAELATANSAELTSDLLESRMIQPLRTRRRREKSISSRALFYAPALD